MSYCNSFFGNRVHEVFAVLKKKLNSKKPKTVFLALSLIEALVKNCGESVFIEINDESFMKEMAKVVRKYNPLGKTGGENRDVAEISADIVQAWGEAFLPRSLVYPNISKAYHELRKEGIIFKAQYDESRAPIFVTNNSTHGRNTSFQYGAGIFGDAAEVSDAFMNNLSVSANSTTGNQNIPSNSPSQEELVSTVCATSAMVRDMIRACGSRKEFEENDILPDLVQQLTSLQETVERSVYLAVERGAEVRVSP